MNSTNSKKQEEINWLQSLNINAFRLITHNQRATRNDERMINKRNTRLYALFRLYYERVQLVGVADNPVVIVNNTHGVPTYLKNFDLFITQNWDKDSKTIGEYKLTEDFVIGYDIDNKDEQLQDDLKSCSLFPIYTLQDEKGYYFTGYSKDPEGIIEPVYSLTKPRVYIVKTKAIEALKQLKISGFNTFKILKGGEHIDI